MDFSVNDKAFLKQFTLKQLKGEEHFLIVAALITKGNKRVEINLGDVKQQWSKEIQGKIYNRHWYTKAQEEAWVDPTEKRGLLRITEKGLKYLSGLCIDPTTILDVRHQGLHLFSKRASHDFDKFLRSILSKARDYVYLADSYIDDDIFDRVLESAPNEVTMHILFNHKIPTDAKLRRFKKQYNNFTLKKDQDLHDRFLIVDDVGYVLSASIKDATDHSPSLIVVLNSKDSHTLLNFFDVVWKKKQAINLGKKKN